MSNLPRKTFRIGERAQLTKTVTLEDIESFARLTGDNNPVHLDEDYATASFFKGRIAHGMLAAGLISAVLGSKLPGPGSVYLSQELKFLAPVRPNDTITAQVEVIEWNPERGRISLRTDVFNQEEILAATGKARLVMASFLED